MVRYGVSINLLYVTFDNLSKTETTPRGYDVHSSVNSRTNNTIH